MYHDDRRGFHTVRLVDRHHPGDRRRGHHRGRPHARDAQEASRAGPDDGTTRSADGPAGVGQRGAATDGAADGPEPAASRSAVSRTATAGRVRTRPPPNPFPRTSGPRPQGPARTCGPYLLGTNQMSVIEYFGLDSK